MGVKAYLRIPPMTATVPPIETLARRRRSFRCRIGVHRWFWDTTADVIVLEGFGRWLRRRCERCRIYVWKRVTGPYRGEHKT